MPGKKMEAAINKQIDAEIYSAYLYGRRRIECRKIVRQLKLLGDSGHNLSTLDRELAQHVFVPPVQAQP